MQRCFTLVRRWNNGGTIRVTFPAPAVASYCAPVIWEDKIGLSLNSNSEQVAYSASSEVSETVSNDYYFTRSRIIREWKKCAKKEDVKESSVVLVSSMKMCASTRNYEKPAVKVQMAERTVQKYKEAGLKPTISLYNMLLHIYCYNNHLFEPTEFLQRIKADDCQPNFGTFELLMEAYGNQGNVTGISTLLDYIKNKGMPMRDTFHATLVTGHSRAGDLEAAENVKVAIEANGHHAHSAVYTSLLCAYAERGLLEDIKKTHDQMNKKKISQSSQMYIDVMNSLSMHGHGNLVADVLSFIKDKPWQTQDLCSLCFGCMSRGEIEAPMMIMSYLSQSSELSEGLLACYISSALDNGLTLKQALENLNEHVNIKPFQWLIHHVVSNLLFTHVPVVDKTKQFPAKGMLGPHPWGKRWLNETRSALNVLSTKKQLQGIHFYPLLARHCSDADIKELIKTFYVMVKTGAFANVEQYINGTLGTAGITMDVFFSSQQLHEETDPHWLGELLIFQCAHGKWGPAASTLEKMDQKDLKKHAEVLKSALILFKRSQTAPADYFDFVVGLTKYGGTFIRLLWYFYWTNGRLNMDLFDRLLMQGVDISVDSVILQYRRMMKWTPHDVDPMELWTLLQKTKHYTPEDNKIIDTLYEYVIKVHGRTSFGINESSKLYETMSQEKKDEFNIRCLRVVHLTMTKEYEDALKEFQTLLKENKLIPVLTWKKMICAAYQYNPSVGDDIFRKMKEKIYPNGVMLHILLSIHVGNKDVTRAEEILLSIQEKDMLQKKFDLRNDVNVTKCYKQVLPLWAEHGELNKILELDQCSQVHEHLIIEAKVLALIYKKQIDQALEAVVSIKKVPRRTFLRLLMKALIFNEYSLTEWKDVLMEKGVSGSYIDSILFFTYVDYDLLEKAKLLFQNLKEIDPREFNQRMKSSQFSQKPWLFDAAYTERGCDKNAQKLCLKATTYKKRLSEWGQDVSHSSTTAESNLSVDGLCEQQLDTGNIEEANKEEGNIQQ